MTRLPELRESLVAAAERNAIATCALEDPASKATERARRTIRHARRLPAVGLGLAAALLTAAVALAASGLIQTGAPVKPLPGEHFTPTTGFGVPVSGSVHLLETEVQDPAGGPPWGLRYLKTTRGLGCLEAGRVVDGRLGVLGQDGSFGDDGRFHEVPPDAFDPLSCTALDGHGQAFIGITFHGLPASATYRPGCVPATEHGEQSKHSTCPLADERLVAYGLLGPEARSITYRLGGESHTIAVKGPLGAYLLVKPISGDPSSLGRITPMASPGTRPFTTVRYVDSPACHIAPANRRGGARPCPLVGFVPRQAKPVSSVELASPVSVRVGPPQQVVDRAARHSRWGARRVYLAFSAPVAISSAASRYLVALRSPTRGQCAHQNHYLRLSPLERDVVKGEIVHVGLPLEPACPGRWSGSVIYVAASTGAGPERLDLLRQTLTTLAGALIRTGRHVPLVGRFSFTIH